MTVCFYGWGLRCFCYCVEAKRGAQTQKGPSLLSFGPERGVGGTSRKKGKFQVFLFAKESNTNKTQLGFSFFLVGGPPIPLGGGFLGVVFGGTGGLKK